MVLEIGVACVGLLSQKFVIYSARKLFSSDYRARKDDFLALSISVNGGLSGVANSSEVAGARFPNNPWRQVRRITLYVLAR